MLKRIKTILLLALLTSASSMAQESDDIHNYDVSSFEEGFLDDSIVNYCLKRKNSSGINELIKNGSKLICNTYKEDEEFCSCINTIAGKGLDRKKISNKIKNHYIESLLNNESIQKEFMAKKFLDLVEPIAPFMIDVKKCLPDIPIEFEQEIEKKHDFNGNASSISSPTLLGHKSNDKRQLFAHDELSSLSPDDNLIAFIKELAINDKTFDEMFNIPRSVELTDLIEEKLNDLSIQSNFPELSPKIAPQINRAINLMKERLSESLGNRGYEVQKFITNNPNQNISNQITEAMRDVVQSDCANLNDNFKSLSEEIFELSATDKDRYREYITEIKYENHFENLNRKDYKLFMNNVFPKNDEKKIVEFKFEADMFYCSKKNITKQYKDIMMAIINSPENLEELEQISEELRSSFETREELTNARDRMVERINKQQDQIENYDKELTEMDKGLELIEAKIKMTNPENKQALSILERTRKNNRQKKAAMLKTKTLMEKRVTNLKSKKLVLDTRIKNNEKIIDTQKQNLTEMLAKNETIEQKDAQDIAEQISYKIKDATNSQARRLNYDSKTNSYRVNNDYNDDIIKIADNKENVFRDIQGYKEAKENLTKTSQVDLAKLSKKEKVQKKSFIQDNYFKSPESLKAKAQEIEAIPTKDLSAKERGIQKNLNSLTNYENELRNNIQTYLPKKDKQQVVTTSSTTSDSLSKLRNEIEELKKQRVEIQNTSIESKKDKKIDVEAISTATPSETLDKASREISSGPELSKVSTSNQKEELPTELPRQSQEIQSNQTRAFIQNGATQPQQAVVERNSSASPKSKSEDSTSEVFNNLVLTEEDFTKLSSLDPELVKQFQINKGNTFSVDTEEGRVIYNPIYEDGKLVRFEKVKTITKKEILKAHKEEIKKVERIRENLLKHSDLVDLFSNVLKK